MKIKRQYLQNNLLSITFCWIFVFISLSWYFWRFCFLWWFWFFLNFRLFWLFWFFWLLWLLWFTWFSRRRPRLPAFTPFFFYIARRWLNIFRICCTINNVTTVSRSYLVIWQWLFWLLLSNCCRSNCFFIGFFPTLFSPRCTFTTTTTSSTWNLFIERIKANSLKRIPLSIIIYCLYITKIRYNNLPVDYQQQLLL